MVSPSKDPTTTDNCKMKHLMRAASLDIWLGVCIYHPVSEINLPGSCPFLLVSLQQLEVMLK